ncbi:dethiobiotin synthase [Cladophialophora bantiana CBS 173.52]|uniref:Dethiobiotin synthase n=1 Tax=Cladophialophora bantiana (strain ATCC 10958 / CBS 173.52 / CDC B-1940 / NIH 8579) TaxID=1442370 RepID=A0A0D2HZF6_CLAB1|nr:dethiobiotin synthase [Cladophialophora bantiana CBS 173.52]KIW98848.1 dethiobiotin synthase [Cladophialophora bantiana CBS 173.52]
MLWRDLKAWQVFGANTNVGKTIVSTLLCRALQNPERRVLYLKPVSTGPKGEADVGHVDAFVPGIVSKYISQFSRPLSPHLAAQLDQDETIPRSDASILARAKAILTEHVETGGRYAFVETAGGVLSPGPSGTVQADLYRPLRLPTILVGDSQLGGIATTISAFESLHVRGYNVDSVVLFDDPEWGNFDYLNTYFRNHGISTFALPKPPRRHQDVEEDKRALLTYYGGWSKSGAAGNLLDLLNQKHFSRISKLTSMPSQAEAVIWHPFRQHGIPHNIIAIDSAYKDHFQTYNQEADPALTERQTTSTSGLTPLAAPPTPRSLLTPLFDASASWWTQGLGHGNPNVALTAAHAAGRYGHVMFAHAVHEPALDISHNLLSTLQNPRLSRVFFTDNGSTGMEVAVKMALRASSQRYGWSKDDGNGKNPVAILGLKGSYHGDTIGVMNCSEPSVFNEKVDWHQPWGHWFDPPSVLMRNGVWELTMPDEMHAATRTQQFDSLNSIFNFDARTTDAKRYESHITTTLERLVRDQGRRFGALILEPIIMGAGGMIFVDPLFQRTLIKTIRASPHLIAGGEPTKQSSENAEEEQDHGGMTDWSGLPIIADEVFTGLYRLGRASSSSFLSCPSDFNPSATLPSSSTLETSQQPALPPSLAPDVSVHAKLLTAGLLPLALTTASESIFKTFLSDSKTDALLHGHSYTAHPIGCMVANKALDEYRRMDMDRDGGWSGFKRAWSGDKILSPPSSSLSSLPSMPADRQKQKQTNPQIYSFFSRSLLQELSHHPRLAGCFALGTILVLKLAEPQGSAGGYTSTASAELQSRLLTLLDEDGCGIHSRVLGDVIYFMASLTTTAEQVERLGRTLLRALDMEP